MDPRRWPIRAKVRVALVFVLLLVLPQIALTIYYLVEMADTAEHVSTGARFVVELEQIRTNVAGLKLRPAAALTNSDRDRLIADIARVRRGITSLPKGREAEVALIRAGLDSFHSAALDWTLALLRARGSAPDDATFEGLISAPAEQSGIDFAQLKARVDVTTADLDQRFQTALVRAYAALEGEQDWAQRVVDHADRNLISLTMLTIMVLAALFVALPGQLVRPLAHLTNIVRQAGTGRLDAAAKVASDDEIGELARAFDNTMDRMREFDDRKRDRIITDAAQLETLLALTGAPAAILTRDFVIDLANLPFRRLLDLGPDDDRTPIPELMESGGADLRVLLLRALKQREDLSRAIRIVDPAGQQLDYMGTVSPIRDRRGRVTHLVLRLSPVPPVCG